jgi:hypothetical protein
MTNTVNQQLLDNISMVLKRSLAADATLADLRKKEQASFEAVFTKDAGFKSKANTFQPYVEELADEFMLWQKNNDQTLLISIVKKIEQLFIVLGNFEQSHNQ